MTQDYESGDRTTLLGDSSPMRRFLVMVLSLLCIALPLQASAWRVLADKHCSEMQGMVATSLVCSSAQHDCCNDAATVAKSSQLCKVGQECSQPATYMLLPTMLYSAPTPEVLQLPAMLLHAHTDPPSAVWRPPNLI